jgi:hypothetical protein
MPKSQCQTPDKVVNSDADIPDFSSTSMSTVSITADIKVLWPKGHSSYSPGSSEELALISIDLLVKTMGTQGAQTFIAQVFERYQHENKGAQDAERE